MMQVTFATRAPGPLQQLTERRQRLAIDAYPLGRFLLLRCFGDVDGIESASEVRDSAGEVLHHARAGDEVTLLLGGGDEEEVVSLLEDQSAHVLPPIRWQRGEARVTLLLDDGVSPQSLLAEFPDARLVSKRRSTGTGRGGAFSSPLFLPALTEKQARALLAAYKRGYYDFPRSVTTEEVSVSLGIARSTFEQHLNRAEHHVVRAMLPMVRMRAEREQGEALEVYSKFSRELGLYVRLEVLEGRVASVSFTRKAPGGGENTDHPYLARILEHVRTGKGDLRDIPLDLNVGPFEREVLEFLRTIPPGETITYGEIARRLGRPGASRAVGTACARNPAVIVIPCHRVVPKGGGVGQYSSEGGAKTKRKLLEREGALLGLIGTSPTVPAAEGGSGNEAPSRTSTSLEPTRPAVRSSMPRGSGRG